MASGKSRRADQTFMFRKPSIIRLDIQRGQETAGFRNP